MSVIGVAPNVRDNRRPDAWVMESYPQGTECKKTSASFLYNATRSLYEQAGFTYIRSKGSHHFRDAQDGPLDPRDQNEEASEKR